MRARPLIEILRAEEMRHALWDVTGWHRDHDTYLRSSRADEG